MLQPLGAPPSPPQTMEASPTPPTPAYEGLGALQGSCQVAFQILPLCAFCRALNTPPLDKAHLLGSAVPSLRSTIDSCTLA